MRTNFNIEEPANKKHLQENPYKVPNGYFNSVRVDISDKISAQTQKTGFWTVAKPQLGLVTLFAFVFLFAYTIFHIFPTDSNFSLRDKSGSATTIIGSNIEYVEEGFLKSTFVDFFYSSIDSLTTTNEQITEDELIDYLSENVDLITLSYLDVQD